MINGELKLSFNWTVLSMHQINGLRLVDHDFCANLLFCNVDTNLKHRNGILCCKFYFFNLSGEIKITFF